ncbi:MAG TPA: GIY-YIG nuclease family protein [Candidatus Peregrinibacteria bacterium]|nr:GIY-YIG nuclease family protein [Candidatus Peregrinibacteria bacterium]
MSKYYVYLARCSDKSLYTGYCTSIEEREKKHNAGEGAKYTRQRRPVKIVYFEEYKNRTEAMSREAHIKRWPKTEKENLIKHGYPARPLKSNRLPKTTSE